MSRNVGQSDGQGDGVTKWRVGMSNELISAAAKASSSLVEDLYRDIAQPSAKRVGLSLETLAKVALSPIALIDWGFERSRDWLKEKMENRLASLPPECVVQPTANITYAALSHIALSADTPELREIYAELLLKAMDARTSASIHPAYFYLVEQLAAEEALVLVGLHELGKSDLFSEEVTPYSYPTSKNRKPTLEEQFSSFCTSTLSRESDQAEIWLTNLCRLGLLSLQTFSEAIFRPEESHRHGYHEASVDNHEHRVLSFTQLGKAFITACSP
jgi:hypothetical protein